MPVPTPSGALTVAFRMLCLCCLQAKARGIQSHDCVWSPTSSECGYCMAQHSPCVTLPWFLGEEFAALRAAEEATPLIPADVAAAATEANRVALLAAQSMPKFRSEVECDLYEEARATRAALESGLAMSRPPSPCVVSVLTLGSKFSRRCAVSRRNRRASLLSWGSWWLLWANCPPGPYPATSIRCQTAHAVHIPTNPLPSPFPNSSDDFDHQKTQAPTMKVPRQQNTPSNPSPTSNSHEATTKPSLPKDYKKVVQSLIRRRDISLEVKIDLWKRFAEYEACVDEENHKNDAEDPVFTNTNATTVGEIGPDVEMPTPWMESIPNFGSDAGERGYNGGDGDSGYEGNGGNSVDGVEVAEEDEANTNSGQEKDNGDDSNEDGNGNRSLDATTPAPLLRPRPSTTSTQVRHDIRDYFASLAERERLVAAREKWVASRAEALWRNARVLGGFCGGG
ncbi:hypothetical protein VC83_08785 [Pseudogymnoascus destructans]|uniref:Uncharacterized protein n=1 Tax=Pseudogymnoascus destructans TaxID=655981 RepID=A0A177A0R5_9PEZI|nr:uncharacterized protein VC83_08785 [Pseudogymnoascus destructans]OAF55072.2 hypothetical protein VC83_08785 [Pseudogymnoascus destructans]